MLFAGYPKYKLAFLGVDICVLTASFFLAKQELRDVSLPLTIFIFCTFLSVQLFFLYFNNLYKRNWIEVGVEQAWMLVKSFLWGCGSVIIILFLVSNSDITMQRNFIVKLYLYSLSISLIARVFISKEILLYLGRGKIYSPKMLIVGSGQAALRAAKAFIGSSANAFNLQGFVSDDHEPGEQILGKYKSLGTLENLEEIINDKRVDEILIAKDNLSYNSLIKSVNTCLKTGKVVRITSRFLGIIADKLQVERYESIPVIKLGQPPVTGLTLYLKRGFDIMASSTALLLLSPLLAGVALGIKLSSKGPVIFKQQRIGRNGQPFDFYKFRSMHMSNDNREHQKFVKNFINADKNKNADDPDNEDGIRIFKIKEDPRIFTLGKFIRKTSIDEFPQFFNVLKGDMSLVGPRPCLPYEWDCYDEWHKKRLDILPGCTGIWQAMGRSTVTFEEMVLLDLYYVNSASMILDMKIILKTIPVILLGNGGY